MQDELDATYPELEIHILGVNQTGFDSGNALMVSGRDLPWLQDEASVDAWTSWGVTYRDVVILDRDNQPVETFNVTTYDLGDAANYDALMDLFIDVATR